MTDPLTCAQCGEPTYKVVVTEIGYLCLSCFNKHVKKKCTPGEKDYNPYDCKRLKEDNSEVVE